MSALPLITRPDAWDLPLFVYVAGAMVLVGAALLAGVALAGGLLHELARASAQPLIDV